jgi:putative intracellular protease/amidase
MTTTINADTATDHSDPLARSGLAVAVLCNGDGDQAPFVAKALHATTIDVLSPAGATLTDPLRTSTIAFTSAHVGHYALLVIPGGRAGARLQDNPDAIELVRAFARSGATPGAQQAGPHLMIDVGVNAGGATTAWQEVGPDIREVSGTDPRPITELPRHLVRISTRIFEQVLFSSRRIA